MPSEYRKHITIEGKNTAEFDYSSIHPRILYATEGKEAPEDAYMVQGWDKKHRDLFKETFNQLINSDKTTKHRNQWRRLAPEVTPDPLPSGWDDLPEYSRTPLRRQAFEVITGKSYDELIKDIIHQHKPIEKHFFTRAWSWLQRKDSDIAEKVMLKLYEEAIVALPVHDSFIVRIGFRSHLNKAMMEAFEEVTGYKPRVDAKELAIENIPEGDDDIITGDRAWQLVNQSQEKYNISGQRFSDWQKVWGLTGWD